MKEPWITPYLNETTRCESCGSYAVGDAHVFYGEDKRHCSECGWCIYIQKCPLGVCN